MSDKMPKVKHDHKWTDLLKVGIFSLVMMAPVTAIGVTCAYVVCNKNAYQSYSGNTGEQYEDIQINVQNMTLNNLYYFSANNLQNDGYTNIGVFDINVSNVVANNTNYSAATIIRFYPVNNSTSFYIQIKDINTNTLFQKDISTNSVNLSFNYLGIGTSILYDNLLNPHFYYQRILPSGALDNVFYYAVDTMQNNTLFSWTKTTAIYSGVEAMTTGMGVTTPAIAVLLVYWLLCTAIYIIIDIVVKGFTWLTHLIGER